MEKKMKIKQVMLTVITTVSLIMGAQVFAQNQMPMRGGQGGPCMMQMKNMMSQLNLTPEQSKKMQSLRQSMRSKMMSDMGQMQSMRQQMLTLIMSDKMDESALDNLVNKKAALMANKMKRHMMLKHQIYQMLTPDQKSKFKSAMEQMPQNCRRGGMNNKNF